MAKHCIVTGALKSGIGEAVTTRLLADGWHVTGTYETDLRDQAAQHAKKSNLTLREVDHSQRASLEKFIASCGDVRFDGLVNNQMLFEMEDPEHFNHDFFEKSVFVNLIAPNILIHGLKSKLKDNASMVIVTSIEGFIGSFGASAYAATKAAVHNLIKSHANNLGRRGIRANAVATGWIGGVMDTDEVFNMSKKITPLGRLGSPSEVASVIAFLLSAESSFVNGTTITVDGGYTGVDTIAKYEFEASKKQA
jgi:NAD(P)-dependent dehydrogenase (short-subunit alcohol dehydrogenase family)